MGARRFLRMLGIVGVATSAIFGAPQLPAELKKSGSPKDDAITPADDCDIIGSHDWRMDIHREWGSWKRMDVYVSRYSKLDEMIHRDAENGHHWTSIRLVNEDNGVLALYATRDDKVEFAFRKTIEADVTIHVDGDDASIVDLDFDALCGRLNDHLNRETV